jgi:large subunit ribosomal protein L15
MKLHQIPTISGATHRKKRLGCGRSSGHGKTCTRGSKGGKSRSGYGVRPGFEGGQTPLYRKLPHRGFTRGRFPSPQLSVVNLSDFNRFESITEFSLESLKQLGVSRTSALCLKVLANGELTRPIKVTAHAFSASAKAKIEAAGGQAIVVE